MRVLSLFLRKQSGQALIEYTIIVGLLGLAMVAHVANVADQIMDIWNDLMQDLDVIDDCVANDCVVCPQSDADESGEIDTEEGGYRDETCGGQVPPI